MKILIFFTTQDNAAMERDPLPKKVPFLRRAWMLETLFFFVVLWQESYRLSSRTAHKILPVDKQLQDFYYYNFGDFVNGYVIAFLVDGAFQIIIFKNNPSFKLSGVSLTKWGSTLFATLFSISVVVGYELMQSTSTTSDVMDIPAGILGALLYLLIRWIALRLAVKKEG
jgi:hypothetical protein